jgi:hypothetical protein
MSICRRWRGSLRSRLTQQLFNVFQDRHRVFVYEGGNTDVSGGRWWFIGWRSGGRSSRSVRKMSGGGGARTRIGEVNLGIGDDILLVLEEPFERGAEVGSGRVNGVPVEDLDRTNVWVACDWYEVLDDMWCDGGCTTYVRRRCERQRKGPAAARGRTGLNDGKDP